MASDAEWRKVFDLHDLDRKGTLPKTEVACVIRSCGRLLLPAQMDKLLARYGSTMTRDEFTQAMGTPVEGEAHDAELLAALMAFDGRDCGELSRFDINQIFCHMAEKIPAAEMEKLLEGGDFWKQDKGNIKGLHKWLTRPAHAIRVPMQDLKTLAK